MSLQKDITADMKKSMKAGNAERVSVLRMLLSSLSNEAIAQKKKEEGLTEQQEIEILSREAKRRQEAAEEYEKGGRSEQARAERQELKVIQEYLPEQLSEEELRTIVEGAIEGVGAETMQDMGRVMGAVMDKVAGAADGNTVRSIVEDLLS